MRTGQGLADEGNDFLNLGGKGRFSSIDSANGRKLIAGGAYEDHRIGTFFNSDRVCLLRNDRQ